LIAQDPLLNIEDQHTWLVTGAAGFIGSHLVESLLQLNQTVIGFDDLSTGSSQNLDTLERTIPQEKWNNFHFHEGDIRDFSKCENAATNANFVLHQAAIGSVPRSFDDPNYVDSVNVGGFLNILKSAANNNVNNLIYASSSAVYGDHTDQANQEDQPVKPQSPYAVGKYANELYAQTLGKSYNLPCVGLRYFNVYGPRQDPNGAYAAVIPKWIDLMQKNQPIEIYGDGNAVRDFCFVKDIVKANIICALTPSRSPASIFNVGSGSAVTLKTLFEALKTITSYKLAPVFLEKRPGDIDISIADTSLLSSTTNHKADYSLLEGLQQSVNATQQ